MEIRIINENSYKTLLKEKNILLKPILKQSYITISLFFGIGILLIFLDLNADFQILFSVGIGFLFFCYFLIIQLFKINKLAKKQVLDLISSLKSDVFISDFIITDKSIKSISPGVISEIEWWRILDYKEQQNYLFLFMMNDKNRPTLIIDLSLVEAQDRLDLIDFIKTKLRSTKASI